MDDFDAHIRSGLDLGGDHYAHVEYVTDEGKIIGYPSHDRAKESETFIGIMEHHKKPNGEWCGGWVGFTNVPESVEAYTKLTGNPGKHELVSKEPLHIEPSLACRTCPSHGFIREGRWSDA